MITGCRAEWDKARKILVHTPGIELKLGAECPRAALFEGPLSYQVAKNEHDVFKHRLRSSGAEVIELTDVLREKEHLLRELADEALTYNTEELFGVQRKSFDVEKDFVLKLADTQQLLDIIMRRPKKTIYPVADNTGFNTGVTESPLYNLMFMRDQMITTDKGVIVCAMNSSQRRYETELIYGILEALGIDCIHSFDFDGPARIEGGDFIPASNHAFFGLGSRTNRDGINEVLNARLLDFEKVYVVKGLKGQDEMHLDTYFNIVGRRRALVLRDNLDALVEVFVQKDGSYVYSDSMPFRNVLSNEGYLVGEIDKTMQLLYGVNVLTLDENSFVGVDIGAKRNIQQILKRGKFDVPLARLSAEDLMTVHESYLSVLRRVGFDSPEKFLMDFSHLNQAYGGPHCLTQVILRGGRDEIVDK